METNTQETLALVEKAIAEMGPNDGILNYYLSGGLAKAGYTSNATATQGLQGYDLEPVIHSLYTILTPLLKDIPRDSNGFGKQANWKAVTAIDTTLIDPGVSEGKRNDVMQSAMSDYNAVYKGFGKEHKVTYEAQYAAKNFDDLRARAQLEALQAAMLDEEFMVLGGNTTSTGIALGQANTPTGTLQTNLGAMTGQATVAYVVGLTTYGFRVNTTQNGMTLTGAAASGTPAQFIAAAASVVKTSYTRTNADATTDVINPGHGQISAECASAVTTTGANLAVLWKVTPKRGEVAWAWYTGTTGAANCKLAAITTAPRFLQVADALSTQAANATNLSSDESQNALHYDGLLTQTMKSGNNGYYKALGTSGGAALTADGAGGVTEISDALQDRWDNYKLSSFDIICNARDRRSISNLILGNGTSNQTVRLNIASGPGQENIPANVVVSGYNSPITGELLRIIVHPWIPQGTILLKHRGPLPYAAAGIPNVWQIRARQDWYSIEWPRRTRAYEVAVYSDSVLQGYFPPANGVITAALIV